MRVTIAENFVKIAKAIQKLLHADFCFVYNGNSLFPLKFWGFWGKRPPKCEQTSNFSPEVSIPQQTTSYEPSLMKIGRVFRELEGLKENKNGKKDGNIPKAYISPCCSDDPHGPISTKLVLGGHVGYVIKCANFYTDRFTGTRATGGKFRGLRSESHIAYNKYIA